MEDLFYTPQYAKTGDVIPYYNEETRRFEGYYLKNWNPDAPEDQVIHAWHHIVSDDNRTFTETPTNIEGGTGSILKKDGLYHMFYCTFEQNPQRQWARHATSTDLVHWTDYPEEKLGPDDVIYCTSDWRDPFVFWNEEEQKWWMLLAARAKETTNRNGCVALCVSDDLSHWEYRQPFYAPHQHPCAYECPDFFRMGDWYYLVYSAYCDGFNTCYRMSKSPNGPWIRPQVDTFDGRAFYAAKTCSDGKDRFIYGWNPTKGENNWKFDPQKDYGPDYRTWNWGGSIIVHKLIQHADGSLGVCPVDSVRNAFADSEILPVSLQPLTGIWKSDASGSISCCSPEGYSAALGSVIPDRCCIKAALQYDGTPSRFGLALQVDQDFDFGYYLMFEPEYNRIQYRSGLRMYEQGGQMFPYAVEMERPLILKPGETYELELYIQDSIAVLYVNQDLAFGLRMYNYSNRQLGFFVSDGDLNLSGLQLQK